jgi:predicted homoserine dehydrogenase-like protein
MFDLPSALRDLDESVRVGVIGAGQFGTKCVRQLERVPGLTTSAVADPAPSRAESACLEAGISDREIEAVADVEGVDATVAAGKRAVLSDGGALAGADLDVIVEATGDPCAGARHAYEAIATGSHVVMATVEADATVGPLLAEHAAVRDLVYTAAYGDQPALIAELVAWARSAGLDVVAAGRGVGSYDANAAIELCAAANATALPPDVEGLHAPTLPFCEVPDRLRSDGGILSEPGVVDAAVSPDGERRVPGESIADGVFVVVTSPDEELREFLRVKNRSGAHVSEDGDYLAFFRPHHLPGAETPVSVARAAVWGTGTGTPRDHVADVTASADEQLQPGTTIDVDYPATDAPIAAELERADRAAANGHVPFALLDGATVTHAVRTGEAITYEDVRLESTFLRHLRALVDARRSARS